uniref:RRM domain-containing protein n=1 Tax=Octactis speculum TaxID=3111310 RepID=A0A7S2G9K3_9STRA|eukprot:CAMPEP_0185743046 /NCGR_PEP_ID=MMETSP1174-20130828/587_1 /TAXON_ID=35687 /ORGANISM="Dictyocha speculum, Strain CCMP1381" /LENGTH=326 /DNA_ID=CAMNT_0028415423 /DNA_START=46 /DNA_END=1026 /DNA_ORIENTATION=-
MAEEDPKVLAAKEKKEKKSKKRKAEAEAAEADASKDAKKDKKKSKKVKKEVAAEVAPDVDTPKKKKKKEKAAAEAAAMDVDTPKKKAKKDKKEKKAKKEKKEEVEEVTEAASASDDDSGGGLKMHKKPQPGDAVDNPTGTLEVFMGNLSFDIDDAGVQAAFESCGKVTNCKWLTDRESGKFRGCGFIAFDSAEAAGKAVGMNGTEVLGRPVKVDFAKGKSDAGGGKGGKGGQTREMQPKPDGCNTLFAGNLSFDIDDDAVHAFFKDCGEISSIRWLTDRETGDFKGCGFFEFSDPDASLDSAAKKNGESLLGRPVRLDFATPRAQR